MQQKKAALPQAARLLGYALKGRAPMMTPYARSLAKAAPTQHVKLRNSAIYNPRGFAGFTKGSPFGSSIPRGQAPSTLDFLRRLFNQFVRVPGKGVRQAEAALPFKLAPRPQQARSLPLSFQGVRWAPDGPQASRLMAQAKGLPVGEQKNILAARGMGQALYPTRFGGVPTGYLPKK